MADQHDQIVQQLRKVFPEKAADNVPPRVATEMGLRFAKYEEKKSLSALVPAQERFTNSMGTYQTGMIGAAMDVCGTALATLLAGRPCTVITTEISNFRPLAADGRPFKVEARLRALRNSTVFIEARADNYEGKSLALSTTTLAVYKSKRRED